jgi:integrase/recombinase XerD
MLTEAIQSYIALRRATGYEYQSGGELLLRFARFANDRGDSFVRAATAIEWAGSASSPDGRNRRMRHVACFARHARLEEPRHEVPPGNQFAQPRRRVLPFIYSPEEIRRLVAQALLLKPRDSLRPFTFSTLLALLASTGLRIGEALKLRLTDFTVDGLIIRKTKFKKSRLVPLHETVVAGLDRYLERRLRHPSQDDYLFVNRHGEGLTYPIVSSTFRRLIAALGLRRPEGPSPRLHSFRFTFAVRALESCPHERTAVGRHMVALSTYLGHVSFKETYWYLEATPHLLQDISAACEAYRKEVAR